MSASAFFRAGCTAARRLSMAQESQAKQSAGTSKSSPANMTVIRASTSKTSSAGRKSDVSDISSFNPVSTSRSSWEK